MDRVAISLTSKDVMQELGISDLQMGFVFSAFTLAYGLCAVPIGRFGDKLGPRSVLTWMVTGRSLLLEILTAVSAELCVFFLCATLRENNKPQQIK